MVEDTLEKNKAWLQVSKIKPMMMIIDDAREVAMFVAKKIVIKPCRRKRSLKNK